jgi:hypothetical protein
VSGRALTGSGVNWALYNASKAHGGKWAALIDNGYNYGGSSAGPNGPWANAGAGFVIKTLALLLGGYTVQDAARHGVSARHLSVMGPLSIGMALDDVPGTSVVRSPSDPMSGGRW